MIGRVKVWLAVAGVYLVLVSCTRRPAEESPKAPESTAKKQGGEVVLPVRPVDKKLEFGIYWTRDSRPEAEPGLNRAKGTVTVPGDGSPPSRVSGLSYRYELGDTINLVPGDGRKVEATISPETRAVVLEVVLKVRENGPASDPTDYTVSLADVEGHALASQKFSTKEPKGESLRIPLVLPSSGLKPDSSIRLVISEARTDRGIVIPLSVGGPVK